MRNHAPRFLVGLVSILMLGCVTTKQAVRIPDLSVPVEDTAKARIYVIRPAVFFGGGVKMRVTDNDEWVGQTGPKSYLVWERAPGEAFVTSKAAKPCSVSLNVTAGKVYYILQRVEPGFLYAHCRMEQIDEERAQKFLKNCKLAQAVN